MRQWLAVGIVFGVVGSLAGGCSSSDGPATTAEFCNEKAESECTAGVVDLCEVMQANCIATRTSLCQSDVEAALSTGTRVFNPNNVSACLAAINATYNNLGETDSVINYGQDISGGPTNTGTVNFLCESVFQGSVQQNGPCTSDFDCAENGMVCSPVTPDSNSKVCEPLVTVQQGDPCSGPGSVCTSGNACTKSTHGLFLCEPSTVSLGGEGAKCSKDADCDPDTAGFCDTYQHPGAGGTGQCEKFLEFTTKDCELYGESK